MVGWLHTLNGQEFEQTQGDRTGKPVVLQFMVRQRVRHIQQLNNSKEIVNDCCINKNLSMAIKNAHKETYLVVQWLRNHLAMQETLV